MRINNIIEAIEDENIFKPFLGDLDSWQGWLTALQVLYGLDMKRTKHNANLIRLCTGWERKPQFAPGGFKTALFLIGRRGGKSRVISIVGAYEATLAGHHEKLAKGEKGILPIIAPTKAQAGIIKNYLRSIFETDILKNEIAVETRDGFDLKNNISVRVMAGDFRTVRGFTLVCSIIDEACFFGVEEGAKIRSDTELIRAVRPGLSTLGGRIIVISSPYAKKGWCYEQYCSHFAKKPSGVLVWNAASRTMNPTLSQSVVDDALREDKNSARSEYLGEFRDDISDNLSRAAVVACVIAGETTGIKSQKGSSVWSINPSLSHHTHLANTPPNAHYANEPSLQSN